MGIKIYLGNVGSGKTACVVRELILNSDNRQTFSNIQTKKIKNNTVIKPEMIIKKDLVKVKKSGEEVYKKTLNVDFWKKATEKYKSVNVALDEAHTLLNSRRAMSDLNKVLTDFLALIRRVLGSDSRGSGDLILISQLERRLDIVAVEMANVIKYHVCHYQKSCKNCGYSLFENNEIPESLFKCPSCGKFDLYRHNFKIEVWEFKNMDLFRRWYQAGINSYYNHYYILDIEKVFPYYNTLQWDNLISED